MMTTKKASVLVGAMCFIIMALGVIPGSDSVCRAEDGSFYDADIKPLEVKDCARCHTSHFNRIKNEGARHRKVLCTDCHQMFHAYNPTKGNYAELMPKCASCHDAPHGPAPEVQGCLTCHTDPHKPLAAIPDPAKLEDKCRKCHSDIAKLLTDKPSKHTEQPCSSCHSQKHGRIPNCTECHESHSPAVPMETADCMTCHPVHTPMAISYPVSQATALCGGCHEEAYRLLEANMTKHHGLTCARCHPKHGQIPACQDCHGEPHSQQIHKRYATCGACHTIAHDVQK